MFNSMQVGRLGQGRIHLGQRASGIVLRGEIVDQHAPGDQVRPGLRPATASRLGGVPCRGLVLGQNRLAVIERRRDRPRTVSIVGSQRLRGAAMPFGLVPVAAVDGHFCQGDAGFQRVGILFDQAQILPIGILQVAALALDAGIGEARLLVLAVQLEDIAELDQGAVDIAGLQQGHAGLVVFFGPFLGAVAGRERQESEEQEGSQQDRSTQWTHPISTRGRTSERAKTRSIMRGSGRKGNMTCSRCR